MKATDVLARQMELVSGWVKGRIADMPEEEWLARPADGGNCAGFLAWHIVATRDWTVRSILQQKRPVGWDGPFAGSGVALCEIPFGMPMAEADLIAERTSPAEVIAYSQAVTGEFVRWLGSIDDASLGSPPPNARDHLALSKRYDDRPYRWELEEDPDDMCLWPAWSLITRPCFSHCIGHLEQISGIRAAAGRKG